MCGICGVASDWLSDQEIKMFMELMHLNVLRGWDGAGVAMVPEKKGPIECIRTTQTGTDLILSDEFKKALKDGPRKSILLGHCRFPTRGENKIENVHPFEVKDIVGVHNGTFRKINKDWVDADKSDSLAVFETMAEKGLEATIKDVDGAYALVWIDKDKQTLNFLRNSERPLHVVRQGSLMLWSSEYDHLKWVLSRAHRSVQNIEFFTADKHYVVDLPVSNQPSFRSGGDVKPEREYQTVYPFYESFTERAERLAVEQSGKRGSRRGNVLEHSAFNGGNNFNHANAGSYNGNNRGSSSGSQNTRTGVARHFAPAQPFRVPLTEDEKNDVSLHEFETMKGWWVPKEKLKAYLNSGCDYCSHKCDIGDHRDGHVHWASYNVWFCDDCWNNEGIMEDSFQYFPSLKLIREAEKARKAS